MNRNQLKNYLNKRTECNKFSKIKRIPTSRKNRDHEQPIPWILIRSKSLAIDNKWRKNYQNYINTKRRPRSIISIKEKSMNTDRSWWIIQSTMNRKRNWSILMTLKPIKTRTFNIYGHNPVARDRFIPLFPETRRIRIKICFRIEFNPDRVKKAIKSVCLRHDQPPIRHKRLFGLFLNIQIINRTNIHLK